MFVIDKKWGDAERDKLYEARGSAVDNSRPGRQQLQLSFSPLTASLARVPHLPQGLETYGVGAWKDIRSNLLPAVRPLHSPSRVFAHRLTVDVCLVIPS